MEREKLMGDWPTIYISGDATSLELRRLFDLEKVRYYTTDIRKVAKGLIKLQSMRLQSVPQLFDSNGVHIGGFKEAKEWLAGRVKSA